MLTQILKRYLRPYKRQVYLIILMLLIQAIASLYLPNLNADLINNGIAKGNVGYIWHIGEIMLASSALVKIESSSGVTTALAKLKGTKEIPGSVTGDQSGLFNANSKAPEFKGITQWLNTNGAQTLASLKGKVVLIDFWTYSCINCIRTLPHVIAWYNKYHSSGFEVVGVSTPEFAFEKQASNVSKAITQFKIPYPVALDNNYDTWNSYNNQYWPAEYLIDANGQIRRTEFGEGNYGESEQAIRTLLANAGAKITVAPSDLPDKTPQT